MWLCVALRIFLICRYFIFLFDNIHYICTIGLSRLAHLNIHYICTIGLSRLAHLYKLFLKKEIEKKKEKKEKKNPTHFVG